MNPHAAYPNRAAHNSHGRTESEHNPILRRSDLFNYFFVLYSMDSYLIGPYELTHSAIISAASVFSVSVQFVMLRVRHDVVRE